MVCEILLCGLLCLECAAPAHLFPSGYFCELNSFAATEEIVLGTRRGQK